MINIFFGSSLLKNEVEKDSLELFIRKINVEFSEIASAIDISIKPLFKNELNDINNLIEKSEYTFFIIYKGVDDEENDEIDRAVKNFEVNNKPKVYVYFKNVDGIEEVETSIINLQNKIANEFSHYYQTFDNIDEIKLRLIENVFSDKLKDSLVIDNNSLKFEGIDLSKYIDYTVLPEFKNNKELQDLYKEYKVILDEYLESSNSNNSDDFFHLEKLYAKKEILKEKMKDKEQKILSLSIKLIELRNKSLRNEDIEKASVLFEQGNMKDCIEALNLGRSSRLIKEAYSLKDKAMFEENQAKYNITWAIKERRIVIDLLITTDNIENKDKMIEKLYEENAILAIDFEVELDEAFSYVEYLIKQGKIEEAQRFTNNLEELIEEKSERKYPLLYAKLYNLFGLISLFSSNSKEETVSYYIDALNYYKMQEDIDNENYLYGLYKNYNNLADTFFLTGKDSDKEEAVKYFSEAISICENLCEYNFGKYAPELSSIYSKYTMLPSVKIDSKYEEFYKKLVSYYKNNEDSFVNIEKIADSLGSLGNYYLYNGSMYDAIKYLEESCSYYDSMSVISTNELRQKIGIIHNQIALIKKQTHDYEGALKHQEKAYEYILVAFKENHLYVEVYFTVLFNLIVMYNTLYPIKAYELLNELYQLIDSMYKKHPDQIREFSLYFYSQICVSYIESNEIDLANEVFKKFIVIYEEAKNNGLNNSFNNLVAVYSYILFLLNRGELEKSIEELKYVNEISSTLISLDSKHGVKIFHFLNNLNNNFNMCALEIQTLFNEKPHLVDVYVNFNQIFVQVVQAFSKENIDQNELLDEGLNPDRNKIVSKLIENLEGIKNKKYEDETQECEQIIRGYVTFISSVSGSMLLDEKSLEQYLFDAINIITEYNYKYPDICINESNGIINCYYEVFGIDSKNRKGIEVVKKYINSVIDKFNKGPKVIPYYSLFINSCIIILDDLRYVFGERQFILDTLNKVKDMMDYIKSVSSKNVNLDSLSKYYLLCSNMHSDDKKMYYKETVDCLYDCITTTINEDLINCFNSTMKSLLDVILDDEDINLLDEYVNKTLEVINSLVERVNEDTYETLVELLNQLGDIMLSLEIVGADEFFVLANRISEQFNNDEDDLLNLLKNFSE